MRKYILDDEGNPVPEENLIRWAIWFENSDRVVKRTETEHYVVSTIFLGLDHSFRQSGPPILYETMVFWTGSHHELRDHDDSVIACRYATREDALKGHAFAEGSARELAVALVTEATAQAHNIILKARENT